MIDTPLEDSQGLFRKLYDEMPQLAWTARADGFIDYYNRGWYEYTGTTYEQMQGWGWESVHDPALLDNIKEQWLSSIATGNAFELQFPLRRHDGVFRWFLTRARPLRDDNGSIYRWVGINTDITVARDLQLSLERERLALREIFEQAPAAIATLRAPEHVFEFVNPLYMQLVGPDRKIIGRPIREAMPELAGQGFFELLDTVYQTGSGFTGTEARLMLQRGDSLDELFVNFMYQPTRDSSGEVNGIFVHGIDVTEHVKARQKLELHASELERVSRMKDEFLATLSHELRTPLTAVLGWARLLKLGLSKSESVDAIDAIERSAGAQAQLIEEVLDVSRITSGKLTFEPEPVELATVTRAAATAIHPAAVAKNIEVITTIPAHLPEIAGNEGRLQQIIWNLLSNAVKFTPRGGSVTVRLEHIGSFVRLDVKDTGMGIETEFLPHVFEAFRQADSSSTRSHGGLGLGLAIVRSLVELHGGRITATSDGPGKGATFTVEFLVLESSATFEGRVRGPATSLSAPVERELSSLTARTILVVDDQDYTRDAVAAILRRAHATVHTAPSVREGLMALRDKQPDSVVCDIAMPEEDGYVFLRELRALEGKIGQTPVIALTAFGRPEDRANALAAGFNGYLTKPVEPHDLVETLLQLTPAS
ncbi:MAG TPA: ATP-binding protein [Thermoanaerobaculia bacterium]|nr:ATP-binding protein [Thermoanaerobaculia bacterium]